MRKWERRGREGERGRGGEGSGGRSLLFFHGKLLFQLL